MLTRAVIYIKVNQIFFDPLEVYYDLIITLPIFQGKLSWRQLLFNIEDDRCKGLPNVYHVLHNCRRH